MKKVHLLVFSILLALILATGVQAKEILINFDDFTATAVNDDLESFLNLKYSQEGMQFDFSYLTDNALAFTANDIPYDDTINKTNKLVLFDTVLTIKLSAPLLAFSCEKYEPTDQSKLTVTWNFMNRSGVLDDYYYEDSNKDRWVSIPDPSSIDHISFNPEDQVMTIIIAGKNDGADVTRLFYLDNLYLKVASTTSVPEPTTIFLLGFGLVGLAGARRKFR